MGKEIDLLALYPKSDRRIEERSHIVTEEIREIARQFDKEFFDGDRNFGYGGYNYNPKYWTNTVEKIKEYYKLEENCKILDVGCAKGFMMYDFKKLMPHAEVRGIDISQYACENSIKEMKSFIQVASADDLPFEDNYFDLVVSINTIHNLDIDRCKKAIQEITRVCKRKSFITVDAWRNDEEKKRMSMWNLTAKTYMHADDWIKLFHEINYEGDYYWFIP